MENRISVRLGANCRTDPRPTLRHDLIRNRSHAGKKPDTRDAPDRRRETLLQTGRRQSVPSGSRTSRPDGCISNDPRIARLQSIVDSTTRFGAATHPVRTTIHYTLTVHPNAGTRRGYTPLLVALSTRNRSATNRHRTARLVPRDLYPRTGRDTPTKHLPRAGWHAKTAPPASK